MFPVKLRFSDLGRLHFRTVFAGYLLLSRCTNAFITSALALRNNKIRDAECRSKVFQDYHVHLQAIRSTKLFSTLTHENTGKKPAETSTTLSLLEYKSALPDLTETQWTQAEKLALLLIEWNSKINVISRKDIDNVLDKHILPTMAMSAALKIPAGAQVMDVGTGGGLPGLPMAICYPEAQFLLLDARGKKIKVVRDMAERLGLKNVEARHGRVEEVKEKFDFVLGRSVTALPRFIGWVTKNLRSTEESSCEDAGIFYIKGGNFSDEVEDLGIYPNKVVGIKDILGGLNDSDKNILHFSSNLLLSRMKN